MRPTTSKVGDRVATNAAFLNAYHRDVQNLLEDRGWGAIAVRGTNQAIATGYDGEAPWLYTGAERYDSDAFHATASDSDKLVAPWDGLYFVAVYARWAINATGSRRVSIWLYDTDDTELGMVTQETKRSTSTSLMMQTCAGVLWMKAGQAVRTFGAQTSGGSLNGLAGQVYGVIVKL